MTQFTPEPQLRAMDLFPDLSNEMDRRISHAETRIKYWVLVGVIVNFVIAVGAAIPVVWSAASVQADVRTSLQTQQAQALELASREKWMHEREIWEARVEAAMEAQGIRMPPDVRNHR